MTKRWVAAVAAGWADSFKTVDTDGNGRISRTEWESNVSKLKLDPAPTFAAMHTDVRDPVVALSLAPCSHSTSGHDWR